MYIGGDTMSNDRNPKKFKVSKRPQYTEDKSVTMSLRLDKELQKQYDEWAIKTNRSRNELMCMALAYAIENIEYIDED